MRQTHSVAAILLLTGCAANPETQITPGLLAKTPVCLTMKWDQRPSYTGHAAPDSIMLLPGEVDLLGRRDTAKAWGFAHNATAWGRAALAPTQRDREGGGWVWWVAGDTLVISVLNPTFEHLFILAAHPDKEAPVEWHGSGFTSYPRQGRVSLRRYKCNVAPATGS